VIRLSDNAVPLRPVNQVDNVPSDGPFYYTLGLVQINGSTSKGDIGRARVRTVGVEEYQCKLGDFILDDGTFMPGYNHLLYVYNVSGPRSLVSSSLEY
jgi:hypothetical protein